MTEVRSKKLRRVSVIIVHYHVEDLLDRCLRSILRHDGDCIGEIIIVDNGSTRLKTPRNPRIRILRNGRNAGFAAANNQGLRIASCETVLFLNPDTFFTMPVIGPCLQRMRRDPVIGAAGCRIVNADGSLQSSCRNFPSLLNVLMESLGIHVLMQKLGWSPRSYLRNWAHDESRRVDWVKGAFLLVRMETLRRTGHLDERFFIYGEEADLCRRMRECGYSVFFVHDAELVHFGGKSTEIHSQQNLIELHRSQRHYYRKHMGELESAACMSLAWLGLVIRMMSGLPFSRGTPDEREKKKEKTALFYETAKSYFR